MVKMYKLTNQKVEIDVDKNRVENMKKRGYALLSDKPKKSQSKQSEKTIK